MPISESQLEEIERERRESRQTLRASVPELEEILYKPFPLLDHGFIRVVDYMGSDAAIVQAARVSYGRGTKKVNEDKGLISYLMRHHHTTPFEMCEIKFHVKLPIFVARQWIRHRTANVNEYSARYSILSKEFYIPSAENLAVQSKSNRQGRGETLSPARAAQVAELLRADAETCYRHYAEMMNEDEQGNILDEGKEGLARELARMNLTLNFYTEWYWKIDLHNLLHFVRLRADSHAQYEIQVYAEAMQEILKRWVPATWEAFRDYRIGGAELSAKGLEAVKRLTKGQKITKESSGMGEREWKEFAALLDI